MTTAQAEHRDLDQSRAAQSVRDRLSGLHQRARAHWGPPLDLAEVLRVETQSRRVRFLTGGASSSMIGCDELDALVHAAEHGYRTCGNPDYVYRARCWLPVGHDGDCCGNTWLWRLLYGQSEDDPAVMVVCSTCTPHRHVPRPTDCPHGRPA